MPDNRNRKRPIQVKFFVDEKEQALIKKKMEHAGIENMSAYIRKMVIDGYVVKLDMPELRELTLRMKSISNSENQIAKRVNSTGNIYETDIEEIKKNRHVVVTNNEIGDQKSYLIPFGSRIRVMFRSAGA